MNFAAAITAAPIPCKQEHADPMCSVGDYCMLCGDTTSTFIANALVFIQKVVGSKHVIPGPVVSKRVQAFIAEKSTRPTHPNLICMSCAYHLRRVHKTFMFPLDMYLNELMTLTGEPALETYSMPKKTKNKTSIPHVPFRTDQQGSCKISPLQSSPTSDKSTSLGHETLTLLHDTRCAKTKMQEETNSNVDSEVHVAAGTVDVDFAALLSDYSRNTQRDLTDNLSPSNKVPSTVLPDSDNKQSRKHSRSRSRSVNGRSRRSRRRLNPDEDFTDDLTNAKSEKLRCRARTIDARCRRRLHDVLRQPNNPYFHSLPSILQRLVLSRDPVRTWWKVNLSTRYFASADVVSVIRRYRIIHASETRSACSPTISSHCSESVGEKHDILHATQSNDF
jgi:hypothetical protein